MWQMRGPVSSLTQCPVSHKIVSEMTCIVSSGHCPSMLWCSWVIWPIKSSPKWPILRQVAIVVECYDAVWSTHLSRKIIPKMTYIVSSGTLNLTIPIPLDTLIILCFVTLERKWRACVYCWCTAAKVTYIARCCHQLCFFAQRFSTLYSEWPSTTITLNVKYLLLVSSPGNSEWGIYYGRWCLFFVSDFVSDC